MYPQEALRMTPTYATAAELAHYLDPDATEPVVPPLATVLLRTASELVRDATALATYTTDDQHMPTDIATLAAFKAATCEQASAWSIHGIDPRKGAAGIGRRIESKSLAGASVKYLADPAADGYLSTLATGASLTLSAWRILVNAGLVSNRVETGSNQPERFNVSQRDYDPITGTYEP